MSADGDLDALTMVVHELRTSIGVLNGYLSMLQEDMPERARATAITAMRGVVGDMEQAVGLLVMASRLRLGRVPWFPSEFDIIEAIGPAVERVRPRAELEGATVQVIAPQDRIHVVADRNHTGRILSNLFHNAFTYSRRPAAVTVFIRPGDPVEIAVRDHGVGVPHERLHESFEPFVRLDGNAPISARGLGLGLYIGRELAALNNGSLALDWSEPGQGSVFVLRLPAAALGSARQQAIR